MLRREVRGTRCRVPGDCLTIIADGYVLIVYGAVVPDLLGYQEWSLTPAEAGHIGSMTLIGMLIGALTVGTLSDILGRS